mmetsp:Transcript_13483/g.20266  ORF Transcript_13483/g.20266 Transcript_13483/m.20266 type:complete len:160 (-) Transcript_13483:302-781(-)
MGVAVRTSRARLQQRRQQVVGQLLATIQGLGATSSLVAMHYHTIRWIEWNFCTIIGMIILFPSAVLWMIARIQLGRHCTLFPVANSLVTTGLFSKFRNPVYIFGTATLIGHILLLNRPLYLLVLLVLLPLQYIRATREATLLENQFGLSYKKYVRSVWI